MHEYLSECILVNCEQAGMSIDTVKACIDDIQTAEKTIMELVKLEIGDAQSSQGHGIGDEFFNRFKQKPAA